MRKIITLAAPAHREFAKRLIDAADVGFVVQISPPTRSLEANAKMWAMLADVSRQVEWYGRKLTPEDWKHVFTASLDKLDVVPNLDGTGFVALGKSTSAMGKRKFADLITLMYAFGAERGVEWSEPVEWR